MTDSCTDKVNTAQDYLQKYSGNSKAHNRLPLFFFYKNCTTLLQPGKLAR